MALHAGTNTGSGGGTATVTTLTTTMISNLTTTQAALLSSAQAAGLSVASVAGLTSSQIPASRVELSGYVTSTQAQTLTSTQIASIGSVQMAALTTTALQGLTATQMAAVPPAALAGLTSAQLASLTPTAMGGLTSAQMDGLTASALKGLFGGSIEPCTINSSALTSLATQSLTTDQIQYMSGSHADAKCSAMIWNLTTGTRTAGDLLTGALIIDNTSSSNVAKVASIQLNGSTAGVTQLSTATTMPSTSSGAYAAYRGTLLFTGATQALAMLTLTEMKAAT